MGRNRSHTRRTARLNPRGVLVMRAGGFGFVQAAEGEFFVPESALNGAFDGDLVEVAPLSPRGGKAGSRTRDFDNSKGFDKPAARVVRVLDRAHDTVVGRYEVAEPFGVVVPEDPRIPYDIFTMREENPDIEDGSLVVVRICQFPTRRTAATGVIEQVLGRAGELASAIELIIARHKLETEFSQAALDEARSAVVDDAGALAEGYVDLRERLVFTVDPADARDFDDAVSFECVSAEEALEAVARAGRGGYADPGRAVGRLRRLGVHIADVSYYVSWNSFVDLEARRRATSVYLVDRVIPMLPFELSDDICSLRPGCVRRTMTVDIYLDDRGDTAAYALYPALICSNARLSYDDALELIEDGTCGSPLSDELLQDIVMRLRACTRLAKQRAQARKVRGGIDFATVEGRVVLDDDGSPQRIVIREKNDATELIEEAMILANETVASYLTGRKWPCAYRVHEAPANEALAELAVLFGEFPWCEDVLAARISLADPRAIACVIDLSRGRSEGEMVSSLLLRAMKRALYRVDNAGHYGLASSVYCHFTSPIRRYPDLVVHRMLRAALTRRPEKFDQEVNALPWICEHASDMERIAEAASRESQEFKMLEYLQRFVGTSMSGVVSGAAPFGLFVRLDCTAEGVLPVRSLGDEYFEYDAMRVSLTGQETMRSYRLGQRVAVRIKSVDPQAGRLEFELAQP